MNLSFTQYLISNTSYPSFAFHLVDGTWNLGLFRQYGGNLHGENIAAAPPSLGSGGCAPCCRALKRQFAALSLPPDLPETLASLTLAAKLGGYFQ